MQNALVLSIDRTELAEVCQRYRVTKLSLFGSSLREDFDPQRSDVDLLVEFAPDANKSLFTLVEIQTILSEMLGSRVDLTTPRSLSKYFRDDVLASAEVVYEQA